MSSLEETPVISGIQSPSISPDAFSYEVILNAKRYRMTHYEAVIKTCEIYSIDVEDENIFKLLVKKYLSKEVLSRIESDAANMNMLKARGTRSKSDLSELFGTSD